MNYFFILLLLYYTVTVGSPTYPIYQDYKCRANRLIGISESYDSHVAFLITPDCHLYLKLDWQMKYFVKKGLDSSKLANLNCYISEERKIFTNIDKKHLYTIHFNHLPSRKIEGVVNRIDFIKVLHKFSNESIKINHSISDVHEDHDYIKAWPISFNLTSIPLKCISINVDKDEFVIKCLEERDRKIFLLSYSLNSKQNKFELQKQIELDYILYFEIFLYELFFNNDRLFVFIVDNNIQHFMPIIEIDKIKPDSKNDAFQHLITLPPLREDSIKFILTTINNVGLLLNSCTDNDNSTVLNCKAYFIEEGYTSRKSVCLYNFEFHSNLRFLSGIIPLKNYERKPTTSYRKDECIKEIHDLLKHDDL